MIPITSVELGPETEDLVLDVIRSGMLAQGKYVEQLEQSFAEIHDVAHAVAVNNGTTALVVAMEALGIGPGDEVVTTPFTFVATLNAILEAGATARFADIGDDFNIDPAAIEAQITGATKAIAPVHLYGYMADMDPISRLAQDRDLHIVEDSAQAVGAEYHGKKAGSIGVGCFSLYATKNISTGEGGMVTTNDDSIADRLRLLRNQGMRARYQYEVPGHNYRLTNLAAAIGIPQLGVISGIIGARQSNAAVLRAGLADVPGLVLPAEPADGRTHVYHQFTIRITEDSPITRDEFVERLPEAGVGCGIYYPKVVFDYDCYRTHDRVVIGNVPNALKAASEVVSIPVHPNLTAPQLDEIVATIRKVMSA